MSEARISIWVLQARGWGEDWGRAGTCVWKPGREEEVVRREGRWNCVRLTSEVGSGVRGICPVVATARAANRETDAMHLTVKDGSIAN